jgi:hypothetical protein
MEAASHSPPVKFKGNERLDMSLTVRRKYVE